MRLLSPEALAVVEAAVKIGDLNLGLKAVFETVHRQNVAFICPSRVRKFRHITLGECVSTSFEPFRLKLRP